MLDYFRHLTKHGRAAREAERLSHQLVASLSELPGQKLQRPGADQGLSKLKNKNFVMMFTSEKHRISSIMSLVNHLNHLEHCRMPVKQFLGCFVILWVGNADGEDVSLPIAGDGPKLFVELLEEGQDAPGHVDVAQVAIELPESFC